MNEKKCKSCNHRDVESLRLHKTLTVSDIWRSKFEGRNHIDDLHTECDE